MKRSLLLATFLVSTVICFAQGFNQKMSDDSTDFRTFNGVLKGKKGLKPGVFADTVTANANMPSITGIPFLEIATITPEAVWHRNQAATAWINNTVSGTDSTKMKSRYSALLDSITYTTAINAKMNGLIRTSVKTSSYTIVVNDLVPVDNTSGSVTLTLPTAPPDKSIVAVKLITLGTGNIVTINTGGSDVFNKSGGGTSATLKTLNQGFILNYNAGGGIWTLISDNLSLASLDNRYLAPFKVKAGTNVTVTPNADSSVTITSIGGSTLFHITPLVITGGDSISQRFNIMAFGADSTGVLDATPAIIAAIAAADANGGGYVHIGRGRFKINGPIQVSCNCQIPIPVHAISDSLRNFIVIEGEAPPNVNPYGGGLIADTLETTMRGMSQLYSTITSGGTTGSAVFGSALTAGSASNQEMVTFKDLMIKVKNNPSGSGPIVGGINGKNLNTFNCDGIVVCIDTNCSKSVLPTNLISGIETPDNGYGQGYSIRKCLVQGFRIGYKYGEHVISDNCDVLSCYYGVYMKNGTHSSTSIRTGLYWCPYDIYVNAVPCNLQNFNIDIEYLAGTGKWYDNVNTIKDTANTAAGTVNYCIINAGGVLNNALFTISGGSKLSYQASDNLSINYNNVSTRFAIGGNISTIFWPNGTLLVQSASTGAMNTFFIDGAGLTGVSVQPLKSGIYHEISSNFTSTGAYKPLNLTARQTQGDLYLLTNGHVGIGNTSAADVLTVTGNLNLNTAGNKINIATGSNASAGTGTLVGGTATISTTTVTASSLIFLQDATTGALTNVGVLTVGTKTAGTSFVVNSTIALDTSNFNWWIVN